MPTYGYHCPACGAEFEVLQRMTDEAAANCPHCGAPSRRVFFPTGIVFKGSGFYATDSRRGSSAVSPGDNGTKVAAGSDGEKAAATGTSGEAKAPAGGSSGAGAKTTTPGSDGPAASSSAA